MTCKVCPLGTLAPYKYVVVMSKYQGKILLSRHRDRTTWETQGGHIEPGEQEEETALREIWEETGLRVELVEGFRTEDVHLFLKNGEQVMKRIVYFLGKFSGQVVRIQESELTGAFLMDYPTAMKAFQYESSRRILKEANDYILSIGL